MQNQKQQRQLKVYGKYRQKGRTVVCEPEIRLKGQWLKNLGFTPGQSIAVSQVNNCLTITLVSHA
ncbi:MAG: SymE family type I addiction module toxin [Bacteroidetes bacterium]|nr:SymE family type I addiction module toxin [Bacteroidota bacterium]